MQRLNSIILPFRLLNFWSIPSKVQRPRRVILDHKGDAKEKAVGCVIRARATPITAVIAAINEQLQGLCAIVHRKLRVHYANLRYTICRAN